MTSVAIEILGVAGTIGAVAIAFGYLFAQFIKGKNSRTREDLDTENALTTYLKNQIDGFQAIVKAQDEKIVELGKEVSALRAVVEEKDKTINKYLEILQNRNPEMDAFIRKLSSSADQQMEFQKEYQVSSDEKLKIFQEIRDFMEKINHTLQPA